jgi:hypothetical protein
MHVTPVLGLFFLFVGLREFFGKIDVGGVKKKEQEAQGHGAQLTGSRQGRNRILKYV